MYQVISDGASVASRDGGGEEAFSETSRHSDLDTSTASNTLEDISLESSHTAATRPLTTKLRPNRSFDFGSVAKTHAILGKTSSASGSLNLAATAIAEKNVHAAQFADSNSESQKDIVADSEYVDTCALKALACFRYLLVFLAVLESLAHGGPTAIMKTV